MKSRKVLIAGLALALTMGTVSIGAACGPMSGGWMGSNMMAGNQYRNDFSAAHQQEIQAIESKYQKELAAKENAIRTKGAELDKAYGDGPTTLDETNKLRAELYTLEQEYWQLRNQVNREISAKLGTTYNNYGGWGPMACGWHENHNNHMTGRGMMGSYMGNGYMAGRYCNW